MPRASQSRTLATRAKLVAAAEEVVASSGYEGLRVEEVVLRAGVAKGTFFAHFPDKDALMDLLIGARMDACLDQLEAGPPPRDVPGLVDALMPLFTFMSSERYVFDVILRLSGAAAVDQIGPIAMTFYRASEIVAPWVARPPFRSDVQPALLAEGIQAFAIQAIALRFCALHESEELRNRLTAYLTAWLTPGLSPAAAR